MSRYGVTQTILHGDPKRTGNCVSACVATYLGVPLDQVPHFVELGMVVDNITNQDDVDSSHSWWYYLVGFMAGFGFQPVQLDSLNDAEKSEVVFVGGPSPRGVSHQVLYRDGELWHDPHPLGGGVTEVQEVIAWRPGRWDHNPTPMEET